MEEIYAYTNEQACVTSVRNEYDIFMDRIIT